VLTRATLVATTVAVIASAAAFVFGSSLSALASHPARYGWNWKYMLLEEAGYGSLPPKVMDNLIGSEPAVDGWSLFTFNDLTVDGVGVPALGIDRRRGAVEPPVVTGRTAAGPKEIALGVTTLSRLGKRVGDRVRVTKGDQSDELTIVGAVTFPAIGRGGADHTSLGRGALVTYDTLVRLAAPGLVATAIFAVIVTYNEFLFALVLTATPNAATMPFGAATLIGRINIDWGAMSAAGVVGALPIVIFALVVQRHLVRGLTLGAVK